ATARLVRPGGKDGPWLDSGDLGFVAEGELFITGRFKDMVIRAGRNLHPQDLEEAGGALPGVRQGCVAVVAASAADEGTERLAVVLVPGLGARRAVARAAARLVAAGCGVPLRIDGLERLPRSPCVVVCNHQSYVDAFVVTAMMPPRFAFVVKAELARNVLTRL